MGKKLASITGSNINTNNYFCSLLTAKQLSMATGENATPIRILHNAAGHLLGPARSLGGVIIGYRGVRVFNPQPVSKGKKHASKK